MRRNRRAGVEDRWYKRTRNADGTPVPTNECGRGMRWRARFVDSDGRQHSRCFTLKRDAQEWLDNEITPALAGGTYVPPEAGQVSVAAVYESWSAAQGHISVKTATTRRNTWKRRVQPQWGHVPVANVKTSAVKAWVAKMVADGAGTPTIENAFGVLRQVMGAALEDKRIVRNPCDGVKLPKRRHADRGYLSHAQVLALADAVDRNAEAVRFLAYTGLRWGEMAALRVGDFDMLRRRVNVSRSVTESGGLVWSTPKTWERRSVPFPAAITGELSALMVGKSREDLVFTDTRGGVLRSSNWRARVFDPAVAKCRESDAAFPTITPHDLRHTAVSLAVSAGANVKAVQRMLGHARASMTLDTYADLFDADLDSVAVNLDAAISQAVSAVGAALGGSPAPPLHPASD